MRFEGFSDILQIHEGGQALVYRAKRADEPVILKVLKGPHPSVEAIRRFQREAELTQRVAGEGVIEVLEVRLEEASPFLVFEDFQALSLAECAKSRLPQKVVLRLMLDVLAALERVHAQLVIHKDINPSNIIWNEETGIVKLIDFGISSRVSREHPMLANPEVLRGTLPYIAPEQTGRMNRSVDYRSDYYSLGVTMYELLTGQRPFEGSDPLELVHAHIARTPQKPDKLESTISTSLSALIMKLLSKTAEERYQSAYGLRRDLERCLAELDGSQAFFALGSEDRPSRVQIPEKLYGRESVIQTLTEAFHRIQKGTKELVFVSGYSGVGKTSVVHEVHRPMVGTGGLFISGKFDQFQRGQPYSSLSSAFRQFFRSIMTGTKKQLAQWRKKLKIAVGNNGQVLVDLIPELGALLGDLPVPSEVPPAEAEQRLQLLFRRFVCALAQPEHPLVLFVDDLQWADLATIRLFSTLARAPEVSYLLIIGAWRDNEVDAAHPLSVALEQMRASDTSIQEILLKPLAGEDVVSFLQDSLHTEHQELAALAELCREKTGGNPFFLTQFVRSIEEEGLLRFVHEVGEWEWELSRIQSLKSTDNVVDLMTSNIQRLSKEKQDTLCSASILGNSVELALLSQIQGRSEESVLKELQSLQEEGLVLQSNDTFSDETTEFVDSMLFAFTHDRIQQAAYQLLPESEKQVLHLKAGRLLKALDNQEQLFEIVQHLNIASSLMEREERAELARLNVDAGRRAQASSAHEVALSLFEKALELLEEQAEVNEDDLSTLRLEIASAMYLAQKYEEAELVVQTLLERAKSPLFKARALRVRMAAQIARHESFEAIHTGILALKEFGIHLPEQPDMDTVMAAMGQCGALLTETDMSTIPSQPDLDDQALQLAMQLLMDLAPPAYMVAPLLMALLATQLVTFSIQKGLAPASAYGFALYGLLLCDAGFLDTGYAMGQLGMALTERFPEEKQVRVRTAHVHFGFCRHWKEPVQGILDEYERLGEDAIEIGDFEYASFAQMMTSIYLFYSGRPLEPIEQQMVRYTQTMKLLQQQSGLSIHGIIHQSTLNLMGQAKDPLILTGEVYDEPQMFGIFQAQNDPTGLFVFHCFKTIVAFMLGKHELAYQQSELAQVHIASGANATFHQLVFYTLRAMLLLWKHEASEDPELFQEAQASKEKVEQWAKVNPANGSQKALLLQAEFARVEGHFEEALCAYEAAIVTAQKNGFLQDEAMTYERAGCFFLSRGNSMTARSFLMEARYTYQRWGALEVVAHFQKRYPWLDSALRMGSQKSTTQTFSSGTDLDVEAILRASQAISQEIELSQLLRLLVKLSLEFSGARKVALLFTQTGELSLMAVGQTEPELSIELFTDQAPPPMGETVPKSILRLVQNTQREVLLANAKEEEALLSDPYVARQKVLSVLALPIAHQGKMAAILYLENEQTPNVFNEDRVRVMMAKVLLAQAAISIENAQLFGRLEELVVKRTEALQDALSQLKVQHQQLKDTQGQLVQSEKMAALGTLVSGVAHELNNPMNFAFQGANNLQRQLDKHKGFLFELLGGNEELEGMFSEELEPLFESVGLITAGNQRMQGILQSLRSFSRLNESEQKVARIIDGLESTMALVQANFPEISFDTDWQADLEQTCWPAELNQAFMNLMLNACQAIELRTSEDGTKGRIILRTLLKNDQFGIVFEDNGTGIEPKTQKRIFEPFFTTKKVGSGTGLGLSTTFGIVKKHKGYIEVQSAPGEGSTFTIWIPHQARLN